MKDYSKMDEKTHTREEWDNMINDLHKEECKVPEWVYYHFLECVPPIYSKQTGFLCGEPYSHDGDGSSLHLWFYGTPKTGFYGQLANIKHHVSKEDIIKMRCY